MPQVEVVDTSWLSPEQFSADVVGAFVRQGLSEASAQLLAAHVALSTGWGKKCHNWSLAGIKATSEDQDYVVLTGFENEGGTNVYSSMKWRAYQTLDEGAAAVVGLLQQERYAPAWQLLQAGDPEYFAEVGRDGWYTANPDSTAAEMRGRLQQIQQFVGEAGGGGLGLLVLVGIGTLLWWWLKKK